MKEGWKILSIQEIATSIEDGDWIESKDQNVDGIRLIQTGNVGIGVYKDKPETSKFISEETFARLHCNEIFEGDILVSRLPDPVGRACSLPAMEKRAITAVDCSIIRLKKNVVSNDWFVYYSQSNDYFSKIKKECTGSTRLRITRKKLAEITIPVPPLSEQQQIVDFLDAEFAKIDELKNQAEQSLQNAKDLFQAALKEMLTPKEGWKEYTIDEVVDEGSPISYGIVQPGDGVDKGVPVVRPVDLTCKQLTDTSSFKKTTEEIAYSYKRTLLKGKEILMCVRGTTGVISLTSDTLVGCNVTRGIVPFQIEDDLLRNFLYYTIKAPIAADYIQIKTQGAALKQINIADVKKIPIWLPSAEEQKSIVSKLEIIDKSCKQLQSNYTRTIQLCADLKQALLRQVFE